MNFVVVWPFSQWPWFHFAVSACGPSLTRPVSHSPRKLQNRKLPKWRRFLKPNTFTHRLEQHSNHDGPDQQPPSPRPKRPRGRPIGTTKAKRQCMDAPQAQPLDSNGAQPTPAAEQSPRRRTGGCARRRARTRTPSWCPRCCQPRRCGARRASPRPERPPCGP